MVDGITYNTERREWVANDPQNANALADAYVANSTVQIQGFRNTDGGNLLGTAFMMTEDGQNYLVSSSHTILENRQLGMFQHQGQYYTLVFDGDGFRLARLLSVTPLGAGCTRASGEGFVRAEPFTDIAVLSMLDAESSAQTLATLHASGTMIGGKSYAQIIESMMASANVTPANYSVETLRTFTADNRVNVSALALPESAPTDVGTLRVADNHLNQIKISSGAGEIFVRDPSTPETISTADYLQIVNNTGPNRITRGGSGGPTYRASDSGIPIPIGVLTGVVDVENRAVVAHIRFADMTIDATQRFRPGDIPVTTRPLSELGNICPPAAPEPFQVAVAAGIPIRSAARP